MKSFLSTQENVEKESLTKNVANGARGIITAHYQLYKKVLHLNGDIINCGLESPDVFTGFATLRNMLEPGNAKRLVAFEKHSRSLYYDNTVLPKGSLLYKTDEITADIGLAQLQLIQKGVILHNEFVSGYLPDAVPHFIEENPELKISFLTINLDDYESAITALQFFYPRLVHGGILVMDNFYKNEEDHTAFHDYFCYKNMAICNFDNGKTPHFITRK